ncbi:MAG: hypothetical protein GY702_05520 [Desulfobulbaceae bacterium]|nr:hypothetical protein [Desulfobulbaceae bacterium]
MPETLRVLITRFLCGAMAAALLPILPTYAYAGITIKFYVEVDTQAKDAGDFPAKVKSPNSYVLLEDSYLHFKGDEEGIYDFEKKAIYSINREKGIYSEMSLFANVGFRDYELRNRRFMSGALEHAGVEDNQMSLIFSEHELSVQAKESKSDILREERNGGILFKGEGKEILRVGGPIIELEGKYRKQFIRFFRHRYGGHPSLIDQLTPSSGIYSNITIWQRNVGEKKTHLHFISVEETQTNSYSLEGLKPFAETNDRLLALVERVAGTTESNRKKVEAEILLNARQLIDKKDLVGAMLAYLEYTLVSGAQDLPWTEKDRQLLLNSNEVQEMLAATQNPTSREEAVSQIASMEDIRKKQTEGSHILKIFESNTRASLGEHNVARELMMGALEANPYIAGAWKDLGGFYFQSYEPYEAWICWDTGRRINPDHPLLKDINSFEERLQAQHPGFF